MRTHNRRTLMHGVPGLLLSLLLLSAPAQVAAARQAAPKLNWREFTSEPGGFTIKVPGVPRLTHPRQSQGPYNVEHNLHEVTVGDDYVFHFDYVDFPGPERKSDLAFESGLIGLTNPMIARGGRLLTKENVVRGTCEGREATITTQVVAGKTGFVQARVFGSGRRFYLLIFFAIQDSPAAREVGRTYVDSLVIKDGCRRPVAPAALPKTEPVLSTIEGLPDAATGWRRIESAEHGFSVLMPGPAQLSSVTPRADEFTISRHEYVHESAETVYLAEMKGDYPTDFFKGPTAHETVLDIVIQNAKSNLASFDLTFGEPRKLSVGPYHAREYLLTNEPASLRGRLRIYASMRRTYLFLVLIRGRGAATADAGLERFFSSIKVSPK